ncbi:chorismate mutase [Bacillus cereus VD196]|uniref:Chorismate mutase n=1 Tax=Bacillus cereus VD196 TaxID=1053243 RepID=A0A9W5V5M5_BACCE|nr:chorismate mutase [Bacillus cereus]EJR91189.1 chorismate mutase [Bacillus cereus VD200]EOO57822.1 chorismate mutase [Bacillus cereus VD196]
MNNIQILRRAITDLDRELLGILNKRGQIVRKIGTEKKKLNLNIYDSKREDELLTKLKDSNNGPYSSQMIEEIFKCIFKFSKDLQKTENY